MKEKKSKVLVLNAIVAAIYIVITTLILPFSFGPIQFRMAEVLNHLVVFDKKYSYGVVGGVVLANTIFMQASNLGVYDLIFGLGHTVLSMIIGLYVFRFLEKRTHKMLALSLIFTVMIFLVGIELHLVLELPFWLSYLQAALGELGVMLIGIPIMQLLDRYIHFEKAMNQ